MATEHPITPPPELVQEWDKEAATAPMADQRYIATQAARWGADQQLQFDAEDITQAWKNGADAELEACCEWCADGSLTLAQELRAARRPKPPSLAEAALEVVTLLRAGKCVHRNGDRMNVLTAALERLQELEKGNC